MRRPTPPVVHPWMIRPGEAADEAAGKLGVHADRLSEVLSRARTALGDDHSAPGTGPVDVVHTALTTAQAALTHLATALDEHGSVLRGLVDERARATTRASAAALDAGIRERTDALSVADARCRADLEACRRLLPTVAAVADEGGWAATLVSEHTRERLNRAGLFGADGTLRRCREAVTADSLGPIRAELAALPIERVRALLARHPDLADRLALDPVPGREPEPALDPHRRAGALSADLWPSLVGPRDGTNLRLRASANRRLLRAALSRTGLADAAVEQPPSKTRAGDRHISPGPVGHRRQGGGAVRRRLRDAWAARDLLTSVWAADPAHPWLVRAELRARIRLYENLLADQAPWAGPADGPKARPAMTRTADGGRPPGHPGHRRVLLFDPAGRGRIAELCGVWPAEARVVAVLVPGTGTATRGFHQPAQLAAELATAVPGSAVVAWMGADFPQGLASHAIRARFALLAAPRLVGFVDGLGVPDGVPITLIGHSYGGCVVGAAERLGVRTDRVVQVASPGAGPGVRTTADYAARDSCDRPRVVDRYELTAPGDPVRWARRRRLGLPWAPLGRAADLGVDPARLDGVTILEAGIWERDVGTPGGRGWHQRGEPVRGTAGHAGVVHPATTAFRQLARIVGAGRPDPPSAAPIDG